MQWLLSFAGDGFSGVSMKLELEDDEKEPLDHSGTASSWLLFTGAVSVEIVGASGGGWESFNVQVWTECHRGGRS